MMPLCCLQNHAFKIMTFYDLYCQVESATLRIVTSHWGGCRENCHSARHCGRVSESKSSDEISSSSDNSLSTIGQATTRSSNYLKGNYKKNSLLIPTTPGDTVAIISSFKSKASSGHDGEFSKLVKDLKYALSFPLSIIINNSLAMGLVPYMAKLAKLIPIYKAKDKKDISNYRPISLLPIISKILEKVVHNYFLYTFLEKNKVVYASQYGFRKKSINYKCYYRTCLSHNKCN